MYCKYNKTYYYWYTPCTAGITKHTITGIPHVLQVHKDELAGRIPLPPIYFGGTLLPSDGTWSHAGLDLELMVKEINVDLTTDVLNQLLVVQIAFIKVWGCVLW